MIHVWFLLVFLTTSESGTMKYFGMYETEADCRSVANNGPGRTIMNKSGEDWRLVQDFGEVCIEGVIPTGSKLRPPSDVWSEMLKEFDR